MIASSAEACGCRPPARGSHQSVPRCRTRRSFAASRSSRRRWTPSASCPNGSHRGRDAAHRRRGHEGRGSPGSRRSSSLCAATSRQCAPKSRRRRGNPSPHARAPRGRHLAHRAPARGSIEGTGPGVDSSDLWGKSALDHASACRRDEALQFLEPVLDDDEALQCRGLTRPSSRFDHQKPAAVRRYIA